MDCEAEGEARVKLEHWFGGACSGSGRVDSGLDQAERQILDLEPGQGLGGG